MDAVEGAEVTLRLTRAELNLLLRGLAEALQAPIPEDERYALRGLIQKVRESDGRATRTQGGDSGGIEVRDAAPKQGPVASVGDPVAPKDGSGTG